MRFLAKFLLAGFIYYLGAQIANASIIMEFNVDGESVRLDIHNFDDQHRMGELLKKSGYEFCTKMANFAIDRLNARFNDYPLKELLDEIERAYNQDTKRAQKEGREPPSWHHYMDLQRVVREVYRADISGMSYREAYGYVWGEHALNCIKSKKEQEIPND